MAGRRLSLQGLRRNTGYRQCDQCWDKIVRAFHQISPVHSAKGRLAKIVRVDWGLAVDDERLVTKSGIRRVVLLDTVVLTVSEGNVVRDETAFSNTGCSTWSDYASRTQSNGVFRRSSGGRNRLVWTGNRRNR